jgi:hypothetical protein
VTEPGIERPQRADEIQAWERACVTALDEMVERLRDSHSEPQILGVTLEGDYPDTKICVRFLRRAKGDERVKCYPLWNSLFTAPRGVEPPSQVALLIHTWIREAA